MGQFIVKVAPDAYLLWSTIVDAPVSQIKRRAEFEEYHHQLYGDAGMIGMASRFDRADRTGTSAYTMTRDEVIAGNRAGPNETTLTIAEIIAAYSEGDTCVS